MTGKHICNNNLQPFRAENVLSSKITLSVYLSCKDVTIIEIKAIPPKNPSGLNAVGMKSLLNAIGM